MTITVSAPNGATVDFPDGTDHGTIDAAMREHFGEPKSADDPNFSMERAAGQATRVAAPIMAGATLGGAIGTLAGPGAPFAVPAGVLIGGAAVPLAEGMAGLYNAGAEKVGLPKVGSPTEGINNLLTKAGILEAKNDKERLVGDVAGGVASMVAPGMAAEGALGHVSGAEGALARTWQDGESLSKAAMEMLRGTGTASNAVIGATSTLGGELAKKEVSDEYKPLAEFGGQFGGGVIGGLAMAGLDAAKLGIKYAWQRATEPADVTAARLLLSKATDADAVRKAAMEGAPGVMSTEEGGAVNLSGSKPTLYQASKDTGVGAMERGIASSPEGAASFAMRRAQQNAARLDTLRGLYDPDANAALVKDYVKNRLDEITLEHSAKVVEAADGLADALAKAGGENFDHASAYGEALRNPLNSLHREVKSDTDALWRAIDPDKKIPVFTGPLKEDAADLVKSIEPSAKAPDGEEAAILENVKGLGPTTTFGNITALRGRLTDAIRSERSQGTPTVLRRLTIMLENVDDLLAGTAGEEAANPDKKISMLDRLQAEEKAFQEAKRANVGTQQQITGENTGTGGVVNEPAGQGAVSTAAGGEGAPGGQVGGLAGDTGVPASNGVPDDVAARYRAARAATAAQKATFSEGPVGSVLSPGPTAGSFSMLPSNVPKNLFDKPEYLSGFIRAAGDNPEALSQMEDYAAFSLRNAAVKDGQLDPARYAKWVKDHPYALRQFPAIAEKFGTVAKAQEAMDASLAKQEAALKEFQTGAAKSFLEGKNPVDAVGAAIANPEQFAKLVAPMRGNDEALAGMKRAVVEYMLKKVANTDEAGTIGDLQNKGIHLQRFINNNRLALSTLFDADERAYMEAVAADMQRGNESTNAMRMPGTSNTAIDSALSSDFGESRLSKILHKAFGKSSAGSVGGIVGTAVGTTLGHPILGAMVGAYAGVRASERAQAVKEALVDILLNPEKAAAAMAKIPEASSGVNFHPALSSANAAAKQIPDDVRSLINEGRRSVEGATKGVYEGTAGERGMINMSGANVPATKPSSYFKIAPGAVETPAEQKLFETLHPQTKEAVSNKLVGETLPLWQRASGIQGEIRPGLGGFQGYTNPNYKFIPDNPADLARAQNEIGHVYGQDGVMSADAKPFGNAQKSGVVRVSLPKDLSPEEIHAIYKTLNDQGLAEGHSTDIGSGAMDILTKDGDQAKTALAIDKALGGKYDIDSYAAYVDMPSTGVDYARPKSPRISDTGSSSVPEADYLDSIKATIAKRRQELVAEAIRQGGGHQGEVSFGDTLAPGQPHPDTVSAILPTTVGGYKGAPPVGTAPVDVSPSQHSEKNLYTIATRMWQQHPASGGEVLPGPEALKKIVSLETKNLLAIWDRTPDAQRQTSRYWYRAAHAVGNAYAEAYGILPRAAHAIMAVLSPQMPWDKNVTLADRVIDTMTHHLDTPWSPEMTEVARTGGPKGGPLPNDKGVKETGAHNWSDIEGKTLREVLDGPHGEKRAAMWIRAFDEAHNPREYQAISPTGEFIGTMMNKAETQADPASWLSYNNIYKAISIFRDPSIENINAKLGQNSKVRSFYNKITNPHDPNGVVIDTHAVAAGQMLPLGSKSKAVNQNFGTTPDAAAKKSMAEQGDPWVGGIDPSKKTGSTGATGDYPIHAEAVRQAAWARGVLPSEMQSVTWETIRTLFQNKGPAQMRAARSIWEDYANGKISHAEAMDKLFASQPMGTVNWSSQAGRGLGKVTTDSFVKPKRTSAPSTDKDFETGFNEGR